MTNANPNKQQEQQQNDEIIKSNPIKCLALFATAMNSKLKFQAYTDANVKWTEKPAPSHSSVESEAKMKVALIHFLHRTRSCYVNTYMAHLDLIFYYSMLGVSFAHCIHRASAVMS